MARTKRFTVEHVTPKILAFAEKSGGFTVQELAKVLKRGDQRVAQVVAVLEKAKKLKVIGARSGRRGPPPKVYGLWSAEPVDLVPAPGTRASKADAARDPKRIAPMAGSPPPAKSDRELVQAAVAIATRVGQLVEMLSGRGLTLTDPAVGRVSKRRAGRRGRKKAQQWEPPVGLPPPR